MKKNNIPESLVVCFLFPRSHKPAHTHLKEISAKYDLHIRQLPRYFDSFKLATVAVSLNRAVDEVKPH